MTAYNREKYITEAIESVLISDYSDFELIIVDDNSSDGTVDIIRKYQQHDNRIKFFINDSNLGDYKNRNKASSYATGEFIMHVDSDDKILPEGIKMCVNSILKFPNSNFGMYLPYYSGIPFEIVGIDAIRNHFFLNPFLQIGPGGTIIKRSYFESINKFPEKYGPANDMYFNLKAACYSNIVLLPFEFMYYRRHEGQEINNSFSYLYNNYNYLNDALTELPLNLSKKEIKFLSKKNKRRFVINIIRFLLHSKNIIKTKEAINKANFSLLDALEGIFH